MWLIYPYPTGSSHTYNALLIQLKWKAIHNPFLKHVISKYICIIFIHADGYCIKCFQWIVGVLYNLDALHHRQSKLIHCAKVKPYGNTNLGQNWLRWRLVLWLHQTNVDFSLVRLCGIQRECHVTSNNLYNEFDNYVSKIAATFLRGPMS